MNQNNTCKNNMKNIIVDINAKMDIDNELMNPKYAFNKNKMFNSSPSSSRKLCSHKDSLNSNE